MMKMLTVTQFSEAIGFTRKTVLRWISEGKVMAIKVDKEYRIPESELDRLFEREDDDIILG